MKKVHVSSNTTLKLKQNNRPCKAAAALRENLLRRNRKRHASKNLSIALCKKKQGKIISS